MSSSGEESDGGKSSDVNPNDPKSYKPYCGRPEHIRAVKRPSKSLLELT